MQEIMKEKGKTEAIVGFEPTGHYWFTLGDHLQRKSHRLEIVNPFHVKCTRELDDNSQTKNDKKDPKTIVMPVKDGRFREVYIPEDVYQELREAVSERERLVEQMTSLSNQVIRWIDIWFPEFSEVFKKWSGLAATLTLKNFPTPAKVVETGVSGIVSAWGRETRAKRLREGLFKAMITMLATNQEFRMLHQRNLGREKNPLNKMIEGISKSMKAT